MIKEFIEVVHDAWEQVKDYREAGQSATLDSPAINSESERTEVASEANQSSPPAPSASSETKRSKKPESS